VVNEGFLQQEAAMSKVNTNLDDAGFEMIELAIDDLELLTRAFDMIEAVCREEARVSVDFEPADEEIVLN
jgi:hypothetical protein